MVAYVVIPGIDGSDGQHWQTLWEREWGTEAVRISPASWSAPELGDWVDAVQEAYDTAFRRDGHVVLVAHSLGCWAASVWWSRNPASPVAGAFLVAPPDPQGPAFPRQAAATFVEVSPQPLPGPALVVGSADDPYCTSGTAAAFATRWAARWHLTGSYGHLNSASGLGSWPHGRELLDGLTQQ
ncbi:RBBP9/YdeN family alpha/beta hydrolase [Streptomyces longispororuber]|uniref:RBBP9/YdeN family alpha/beta hydrolase n=1 Tax=Streptomyces longispororuber TaxID=68230 RepID=UPI00210D89FD|nr:alpha/beta hydrolase [Streptomyces longispororuber]MCQ4211741.1 alpha/beta fold hydrolase [Streptomyces longispororuber]